jgi:lipopolysaccharide/colanic/teichoic acid biosynthesis glycosyltransferase
VNSLLTAISDSGPEDRSGHYSVSGSADRMEGWKTVRNPTSEFRPSRNTRISQLSPWSRSGAKRLFDVVCVLLVLPLLVPVLLVIALAVRLTSYGPVLFLQKRMGRHGQTFTILKFRTMTHLTGRARHAVTTTCNQQFTLVGCFLRRWKLDELPQLLNVLWGDMSLVGPRPKMPEHVLHELPCRPGVTGAATIAFAHEAVVLCCVPEEHLEAYYHTVVLPAKRHLDAEYMARATLLSDFKLLVNSVLRQWDIEAMKNLLDPWAFEAEYRMQSSPGSAVASFSSRLPKPPNVDQPIPAQRIGAFPAIQSASGNSAGEY